DDRRAARAAGVRNLVLAGVRVFPEDVAGLVVQAQDALLTVGAGGLEGVVGVLGALGEGPVGDVDLAAGDGGAGVAAAVLDAPAPLGPAGRELLDAPLFAPAAVPLRAEPLRPVVGACGGGQQRQRQNRQHETEGTDVAHRRVSGRRCGGRCVNVR